MTTIKELRELCEKAEPLPYDTGCTTLYETESFEDLIESGCCGEPAHFRDQKTCNYVVAACNSVPQLLDLLDQMAGALGEIETLCAGNMKLPDTAHEALAAYEKMKGKSDE